ncbi:MAG: dicarboxylate/amino acid:cation symporter [Spirochaetaceae bacterium]|nr:dicarboxylate/amino acid:cation symporter [Spirochaetaceae bacterium]
MSKKPMGLTTKILVGMALGIIVGTILNQFYSVPFVKEVLSGYIFKMGSTVFLNLVKMTIVPLVFISITVGASQMGDVVKLGRVGGKILGLYVFTSIVALAIALPTAFIMRPGVGFDLSRFSEVIAKYKPPAKGPAILDTILRIIPDNPFAALTNMDMMQIIFYAIFLGVVITLLGDKVAGVKKLFIELNDIVLKIIGIVMKLSPYGVFFLAADSFVKLGFSAYKPLGMYMITVVVALTIHAVVVYGGALKFIAKCSPIQFLKNYFPAISLAFSTASSNATMAVSLDSAINRCGIDQKIASFSIPVGITINMDGSAISQGVATIFVAQAYGIPLDVSAIITIVIMCTLITIGSPGIPGASTLLLVVVWQQVGLPVEAVGMILGVDRILSMIRTMTNVSGDIVCGIIVAQSEGLFHRDIYERKK